jgi:phenylacetate-CoA ligase
LGRLSSRQGRRSRHIARRQLERLRDIVSYAGTHSAYFESRYRGVPEPLTDVTQLFVTTEAEMMGHFDEWVTDPSVNRKRVEAFIADPDMIGHDYLGRYVV